MFKRNQIVHVSDTHHNPPEFFFFGRIVKKIDDENYLVVWGGRNFGVLPITHIEATDYKGDWFTVVGELPEWKKHRPDIVDKYYDHDENGRKTDAHIAWVPMTKMRKMKQNSAYYNLVWRKQRETRRQRFMRQWNAKHGADNE